MAIPLDPRLFGAPLAHAVSLADAKLAVTSGPFLQSFRALSIKGSLPPKMVITDLDETVDRPIGDPEILSLDDFKTTQDAGELPPIGEHDVAMFMFTSGTTGPPKLAVVHWAQLHAIGARCAPPGSFGPEEVMYAPFPDFHHSSKMLTFAMALAGGQIVLTHKFSASTYWQEVRRYGCTAGMLIAGMPSLLLRRPEEPDDADQPLRRAIMSPVIAELDEFRRRFGVEVATSYGMTEISVPFGSSDWKVTERGGCGSLRPGYPHYDIRIVDEHDEPLPDGQAGELVVRTREPWTISTSYFRMPDKTVEAWRNGWFHTGDAVRVDELGNYFLVDRIKDCIRRRGENLSSFEIESIVAEHPEVSECAAVGVPTDLGDDDVKVFVVLTDGSRLAPEELVRFLRSRMPAFMVPRYVEYLDLLPRTESTVKVKKALLRQSPNDCAWDSLAKF